MYIGAVVGTNVPSFFKLDRSNTIMSVISNEHTFVPFVSGKSVAFEGQRLSQVTFKTPKDKSVKKLDSKCVSIPQVAITTEQCHTMRHHIIAMLETAQDKIVRERVIAGNTSVNDEHISFAAILEYLDAESEGNRISKDDVYQWFDADNGLGNMLTLVFAEKLGISQTPTADEDAMVSKAVNEHREVLGSLAGGKTMLPVPVAVQMRKTLEKFCDSEDVMAMRFVARLGKMESKVIALQSAID